MNPATPEREAEADGHKLRIYCDRSLVPEGSTHVPMLDPFWSFTRYDPEGNFRRSIEPYMAVASGIFELAPNLADADAALLPMDWSEVLDKEDARKKAWRYLDEAKAAGKRVIVFFGHDAPIQVDWPDHAVVFRIAVHRRMRKRMEFIVPQWSKDYLLEEFAGELSVREKTAVPTVGFCGFAPPLATPVGKRWLKECARLGLYYLGLHAWAPSRSAHAARVRALLELRRAPEVACNFLIRSESAFDNQYGAFLPGGTVEAAKLRRREFAENLLSSDYVLCSRGWANCSIRFYETLLMGRIPVLVDTDVALPYESQIDWKKHCVIVPEGKLREIGRRIRDFHDRTSPEEFTHLQRTARKLYEEWLSPLGFFRHLHCCLASADREYPP